MPRPVKKRLDYAGWSVDIFDADPKIDALLDAQGWTGFSIYFWLCQHAYGSEGYYYSLTDTEWTTIARKMGCGIRSKTIQDVVRTCCRIGLFDNFLYEKHGILTSKGIQRRYFAVIQERKAKLIVGDYWILSSEEAPGVIKCTHNSSLSPINPSLSPINPSLSPINPGLSPIKKRKEKESTPEEKYVQTEETVCGPVHIDPTWVKVMDAYARKFGREPYGSKLTDLQYFFDSLGDELVLYAIDLTVRRAPVNKHAYMASVLRNWEQAGITTLAQAQKQSAEYTSDEELQDPDFEPGGIYSDYEVWN